MLCSDGSTQVRLLDRCGAMTKLSQGEWISPGDVEAVLEACPLVAAAFVMARSDCPFPVAVVVPSALGEGKGAGKGAARAR